MVIMISSAAEQHLLITPSSTKLAAPQPQPPQPPQPPSQLQPPSAAVVESAKCDSCGFTEECTPAYIRRVRDRYKGHWVCGLCAEAIKDELLRSQTRISVEEAVRRHTSFCQQFRSWSPVDHEDESEHPISVIGRILRRRLDGTLRGAVRTSSDGALPAIDAVKPPSLVRSGSCFPSLST